MKIKKLIEKTGNNYLVINNHTVNNLVCDSRDVKVDDVFFAIKGFKVNGSEYINDAIKKGAKTIIYDEEIVKEYHLINYIKVDNVKTYMALLAKHFYKDISKKMRFIAVTGTNGKTTVSTLLSDFLAYFGIDSLLIGTNGIYVLDEHYHTNNTTPNILDIYDAIKYSYKRGIRTVIIEASSIGIREARLMHLDIDIIIFTNIGHDHLDYHKNITDYRFSKATFLWNIPRKKNKYIIINKDDDSFPFLCSLISAKIKTYGIEKDADYNAYNIKKNFHITHFETIIRNNRYLLRTSLVGGFNIYNLLAVLTVIDVLGINIDLYVDFLKFYISVNGRMNKIIYKNKTIIIDFAHTPSSVNNVLVNIKEFSNYKLCVVLGCGGNRDVSKRSEIGLIATKYADRVIFTTDNPRDENPTKIIADMISKITTCNYEIILDRKEAILNALNNSTSDEIIVILGKGSEREQIINGIKYPFSDKKVVKEWIESRKISKI